jgi:hypothetical protein
MGAINTAAYLATIRSRMDAQQQVVAMLESELQKSILGSSVGTLNSITGDIAKIYTSAGVDRTDQINRSAGVEWVAAIKAGNGSFQGDDRIDQDSLRQLLYQARALLGELRIEEQAWNGEVNSEKTLRKEVNDFAKA